MPGNPWIGRSTAQLDIDAQVITDAKLKLAAFVHAMGRAVASENIPFNPEIMMTMAEDQAAELDGYLCQIKEAYGWTANANEEAQDLYRQWMNQNRTVAGKA